MISSDALLMSMILSKEVTWGRISVGHQQMARLRGSMLFSAECSPTLKVEDKGKFLYSTVSSPYDCTQPFTPWQTCSFQTNFSGRLSAMLQLLHKNFIFTYIHALIYMKLAELQNGSRIRTSVLSTAIRYSNSYATVTLQTSMTSYSMPRQARHNRTTTRESVFGTLTIFY